MDVTVQQGDCTADVDVLLLIHVLSYICAIGVRFLLVCIPVTKPLW